MSELWKKDFRAVKEEGCKKKKEDMCDGMRSK